MSTQYDPTATPVSIVIPVLDRLDATRRCLASLREHTPAEAAEIIVVDNGSNDGTVEELRELCDEGGIRVLFNDEDLGFARACNQGAAAAKHPYVLFLHNDVEVTPDWLDPLVETLDLDAMVGAAGSKLLYPDGTIRHAGVALVQRERQDGRVLDARNLCDHKPADFPPANHAQMMRCLSAACLLVRKDVFDQMGGFDTGFRNGYEDVDLCLGLTERDWNLVYRPESVVVHYESQGDDESWETMKENVVRLNVRWRGRAEPDYYVDENEVFTPSPEFSIRTYAPPRLHFDTPAATRSERPTATVVVVLRDDLENIESCTAALLEHTDPRHGILFVDDASQDGGTEWLRGLCAEEERCAAIYNAERRGFAACCNQGMAHAVGDHVVLLDGDVIVTEDWLEILLEAAAEHPQAGLVGPVTNRIGGSQQLPKVGYDQDGLKDLDVFARMHREATRGNDELVLWLTGFCLLVKRDLVARIGGLDERFDRGDFEDNDYCLRNFLAGYQALIATDCFVHRRGVHDAADAGRAAELEAKWEVFKDKWNVPAETPYGGTIDLERILVDGFDPVLHYHPLPHAKGVTPLPPAPRDIESALERGEDAFTAGRHGDAETFFRWVLGWHPEHSRAANDLAVTLWKLDAAEEAVSLLEKLLAADPDDADAAWNLREIKAAVAGASATPDASSADATPAEDRVTRDAPVI